MRIAARLRKSPSAPWAAGSITYADVSTSATVSPVLGQSEYPPGRDSRPRHTEP